MADACCHRLLRHSSKDIETVFLYKAGPAQRGHLRHRDDCGAVRAHAFEIVVHRAFRHSSMQFL